jgi:hypothetical protein
MINACMAPRTTDCSVLTPSVCTRLPSLSFVLDHYARQEYGDVLPSPSAPESEAPERDPPPSNAELPSPMRRLSVELMGEQNAADEGDDGGQDIARWAEDITAIPAAQSPGEGGMVGCFAFLTLPITLGLGAFVVWLTRSTGVLVRAVVVVPDGVFFCVCTTEACRPVFGCEAAAATSAYRLTPAPPHGAGGAGECAVGPHRPVGQRARWARGRIDRQPALQRRGGCGQLRS